MIAVAATFWPEISGDYTLHTGRTDLASLDLASFLNVVYSYFVSHPTELRHEVRKNFEEFLTGAQDETPDEMKALIKDDRPIAEQTTTNLLAEWDAMNAALEPPSDIVD